MSGFIYLYKTVETPEELFGDKEGQEGSAAEVSEAIHLMPRDEKFGAQEYEASKGKELRLRELDAKKGC